MILTQRRVFVLPTRQGLAYAVSLLVMLVGAINYNLSLGYALVFLLPAWAPRRSSIPFATSLT